MMGPATISDLPCDTVDSTFHGCGRVSAMPAGLNMSGHHMPEGWRSNETQCAHHGVVNALARYGMPEGSSLDVSQGVHHVPSNTLGPQGTRTSPGLNAGYGTSAGLSSNNHQPSHHAVSNVVGPQGTRTSPKLSKQSENRAQADDKKQECENSNHFLTKEDQRDPVMRRAREIAEAGGGLSGFATVMIRQIPYEYLQKQLMYEINDAGFKGTYDFIYLPMCQKNNGNTGLAFVNFLSPIFAERFYRRYHQQKLDSFGSTVPINVVPSDVQGFEQSAAHFYASWHRRKKKRRILPIFLRPVPRHLRSVAYQASSSPQGPSLPSTRPVPAPSTLRADAVEFYPSTHSGWSTELTRDGERLACSSPLVDKASTDHIFVMQDSNGTISDLIPSEPDVDESAYDIGTDCGDCGVSDSCSIYGQYQQFDKCTRLAECQQVDASEDVAPPPDTCEPDDAIDPDKDTGEVDSNHMCLSSRPFNTAGMQVFLRMSV